MQETLISMVNERLADEIDELRNEVNNIRAQLHLRSIGGTSHEFSQEIRDKNIILRYFPERVDEDIKKRMHNMIRYTQKRKNIPVIKAERMVNKHNRKRQATLDSRESKQSVLNIRID